jgi:hypothetical protein
MTDPIDLHIRVPADAFYALDEAEIAWSRAEEMLRWDPTDESAVEHERSRRQRVYYLLEDLGRLVVDAHLVHRLQEAAE